MAEKTCTTYSFRVMFLWMLPAALVIPLLYVSFYTDLFQSILHLQQTEITGYLYKNRRIIKLKPSATKFGNDLKQQNSKTVPNLVLQKPTARFQPITNSKLEMQTNETNTSRLIFDNSYSHFWVPSKALSEGLKLDLDSNLYKVNFVGNKTMLIVIDHCPKRMRGTVNNRTMKTCKYNNCLISTTKSDIPNADAVVFIADYLPPKVPHRVSGQPWVLRGWESPVYTPARMGRPEWRGVFNWSMTYTMDSDIFTPVGMFVPTAKSSSYQHLQDIVQKKTKTAVWFVSNCKTASRREEYVKRLQKVIDVDIFGRCGTPMCPKVNYTDCDEKMHRTYKFYLSFENSLCKDYITEKLYKTFNVPCVPVVRGGADYEHLVPRGTYINAADFRSPEELGRYLKNLSDDIPAYMEILMRKEQYRTWDSSVVRLMGFCDLCYRLNHPSEKRNIHKDIGEWLKGKCHAPTDLKPIPHM